MLCFHLGMTERFLWDYRSHDERMADATETRALLKEIHDEIVEKNSDLIYKHEVSS